MKWILYADDVVMFAKSVEEAEILLNILHSTCKRFGLNISFKKKKTQVFNDETLASIPTLLKIDGQEIENVKEFTYLGHVFSNQSATPSIEHRIARANAKFNQLREVLCDTKVNRGTRLKLLEACVVPRLLYGLQACSPTEVQIKKIQTCWFQILRSMVRGGWRRVSEDPDNSDYRFVYSKSDLESILRSKPIRGIARSWNLRYFGHVCRDTNVSITKKLMFAESKRANYSDPWKKFAEERGVDKTQLLRETQDRAAFREFCRQLQEPIQER